MNPPLEKILAYSNRCVIERFARKNKINENDAQEIFAEMLKMLWLMRLRQIEEKEGATALAKFSLFRQMGVLDEMWHNFMLFSKEYTQFCTEYFGHYLHHAPTTYIERQQFEKRMATDPEGFTRVMRQEVADQSRYIGEKLGVATLVKWFKEFPTRFPTPVS